MKISLIALLCASRLLLPVLCFSPQDHEIFRLHDEVEAAEGQDVSFYDFLGVTPSATQDDISKAYRKKSRLLHPDKAKQSFVAARATATNKPKLPGGKKPKIHVNKQPTESEIEKAVRLASQRYARLGVITEILKGSGRERYDFFLAKGFPSWRGTGYYYARFRPGLGTVLSGLFIFGGGLVHYAAMYIGWKRQTEFVERYVRQARKAAWGDESGIRAIPGVEGAVLGTSATDPSDFAQENGAAVLNRRQKRMQEKEVKKEKKSGKGNRSNGTSTPQETEPEQVLSAGPQGAKKKVQAENGKTLIVDSYGRVFIEGENENGEGGEYLLDPSEIAKPTYKDTVVYRLPVWTYKAIKARVMRASIAGSQGRRLGDAMDDVLTEDDATLQDVGAARDGKNKSHRRRNGKA